MATEAVRKRVLVLPAQLPLEIITSTRRQSLYKYLLDKITTQHYRCVVIPPLTEDGLLPAGIHEAEWTEVWNTFGTTPHRKRLLAGFRRALIALKIAGCRRVFLDGSFVTAKEQPNDFDACWDTTGVDLARLDPILLKFDQRRLAQKTKYGGEMFPAIGIADHAMNTFIQFFQIDKNTGVAKGIIAINLERLEP